MLKENFSLDGSSNGLKMHWRLKDLNHIFICGNFGTMCKVKLLPPIKTFTT